MKYEELLKFCGNNFELDKCKIPFSDEKFSYATNGHIAIKVNKLNNEKSDFFTGKRLDKFLKAVNNSQEKSNWMKIKKVKAKKEDCMECDGAGKVGCNCPICNMDHDCENCKASGKTNKFNDGTEYLNSKFANAYLEMICGLPNVEISPDENNENGMAAFRFDGGCGCLMPMRK